MTQLISLKVIRKPEVLSLVGLSNASLYRLIKDSLLPPPFSLGCRAVGWYEHEINSMNKARAAGKSEAQVKELVSDILIARKLAA